jgi:hypothetical protein
MSRFIGESAADILAEHLRHIDATIEALLKLQQSERIHPATERELFKARSVLATQRVDVVHARREIYESIEDLTPVRPSSAPEMRAAFASAATFRPPPDETK